MSQVQFILYIMLILTMWIIGPLFLIVTLFLIAKKPRTKRLWIIWVIMAVLNTPGLFVLGGWGLMAGIDWVKGIDVLVKTSIVFGAILLFVLGILYRYYRRIER